MSPTRLVFAGAGPRGTMLLERLLARIPDGTDAPEVEIVLVDPHPPGAGRIWRAAQSPLLKLNSMARDVTVFTDDSCRIEGPIRPGPTLADWAAQWREGLLPDVQFDEPAVAAEAEALRGDSFPTRRLHSHYLDWFFRRTLDSAPPSVTVFWHRGVVTGVRRIGDSYAVSIANSEPGHGIAPGEAATGSAHEIDADTVVLALGHNGTSLDAATLALSDAASAAGVVYIPPAFTADADLSVLPAGADVIVRGMGLAAIDLVVLLTQGRGGQFVSEEGALRYLPSGDEPRLHLGSRRGVPYRSKVSSEIRGEPPQREALTDAAISALRERAGTIDFTRDVWPLIATELLLGHYRELFTGHPQRVRGEWPGFRKTLLAHHWDDPAVHTAIAAAVPDPLDRFDIASFDRPLADEAFASAEEVQARVRRHIAEDLLLRTTPEHSPSQAVFLALLLSFGALAEIPEERWNARSRAESLPRTWHRFFSYVGSGPPAHRLQELLALHEAGVVRFLGPEVSVRIDPERGAVARSAQSPGETAAGFLVDAWLPDSDAQRSDNPALRDLVTGLGSDLTIADESFRGALGRIRVDRSGRVRDRADAAQDGLFATGPFTSSADGGAFTRPGSDALPFRQLDRLAGEIAARLRLLSPPRALSVR